jgi:hypothetical protein
VIPAAFPVFTEAYMARLARYWVARYGAYPVIWTIAQEVDKNYYDAYNATTIRKWFAAAQSIADNDAYHQPVMPHMENTDHTTTENSSWSSKPYHSGWAVQWQGDLTDASIAKAFWDATPTKPVVLYESAYDHFWTDSRSALGSSLQSLPIRHVRLWLRRQRYMERSLFQTERARRFWHRLPNAGPLPLVARWRRSANGRSALVFQALLYQPRMVETRSAFP